MQGTFLVLQLALHHKLLLTVNALQALDEVE